MKLTKSELAELEGMSKQEAEQFEAYNEEQNRLAMQYELQEHKRRIQEAIELLTEAGYKITK